MPNPDWCHTGRDGDEAVIAIFGDIPSNAEDFFAQLRDIPAPKTVSVFINSWGGDLYTALAISNKFRDWQSKGARIVCEVTGVAGSAAAVIATAADEVKVTEDGFLLFHRAHYADGSPEDERVAQMTDGIVWRLAGKSGRGKDEMQALLAEGKWLSASEAVSAGLVDEVCEGVR